MSKGKTAIDHLKQSNLLDKEELIALILRGTTMKNKTDEKICVSNNLCRFLNTKSTLADENKNTGDPDTESAVNNDQDVTSTGSVSRKSYDLQ